MTGPVLVTGAAGFIGSHLVDRLLDDGHDVVGVDDLSTGHLSNLARARRRSSFRLVEVDVVDPACRDVIEQTRPDTVMHLAAQMDVRKSVADPLHDARVNVLGTVNVLEAAVRAGTRKVVFASSGGTVYGQPEHLPAQEQTPLRPASPYGAAKVGGEVYLEAYGRLHGLGGTSLALGNVYGPRQDPHGEAGVVSIFAQALATGQPTTIYGDGTSSRDYVHVADVVEAFVRCSSDATSGRRYNVGTGTATSVRALHDVLAEVCGSDARPRTASPRAGELHTISLDSAALSRDTGWRPRVPLREGLEETVAWVRARRDTPARGPSRA